MKEPVIIQWSLNETPWEVVDLRYAALVQADGTVLAFENADVGIEAVYKNEVVVGKRAYVRSGGKMVAERIF